MWLVILAVLLFLVGFFWPSAAELVNNNLALNLGTSLGMLPILLCPLSAKCRANYFSGFNELYQGFFTELGKAIHVVDAGAD